MPASSHTRSSKKRSSASRTRKLTLRSNAVMASSGNRGVVGFDLAPALMKMLLIVKFHHWETESYALHKATDDLYATLNTLVDKFVEVLLGKVGRAALFPSTSMVHNIELPVSMPKTEFIDVLQSYISMFQRMDTDPVLATHSDLLNIRDEINSTLNQFMYLSTFP
jgi:hypothetical protein